MKKMMASRIRHRVLGPVAAVGAAAVLLVACSSSVTNKPVEPASTAYCPGGNVGAAAVSPALGVKGNQRYIFRCDQPKVDYTKATRDLANLAGTVPGVGTMGLKSTPDAVAVLMVEDDPKVDWGTDLLAAERKIFEAFATHRSDGDWLILVMDVVVHGSADPIAPTAYRWTRQEVEDYAACGIPQTGRNDCSATFYKAADVIVLAPQGGPPHGA